MQDHFEIPSAKRRRISDVELTSRPSESTIAETQDLEYERIMGQPAPHLKAKTTCRGHLVVASRQEGDSLEPGPSIASPTMPKPRRVRTGCLTCRNRHLKCDEALPICLNCQKSNRKCERGIRLNFIDLKVEQPPYLLPQIDWKVQFQDESRQIASEYVGGLARYVGLGQQVGMPLREAAEDVESESHRAVDPLLGVHKEFAERAGLAHAQSVQGLYYPVNLSRSFHEPTHTAYEDQLGQMFSHKSSDAYLATGSGATPTSPHIGRGVRGPSYGLGVVHDPYGVQEETTKSTHGYKTSDVSSVSSSLVPQGVAVSSSGSFRNATGSGAPEPHDGLMTPQSESNGERDYLNSPEEVHYMQVFIEEVAVWMDSLDNQKHFGHVIPYLALKSPMLLNAFLACGVKHLTLVDGGSYKDDKALYYYDTATTQLLRSLQNPERNTAECATTAVVLNVYEIMSEKPAARMNHIAGARALIRECKWDATSTGIGAACFWLNVGMEVLSCLAFNWATAWDPDHWGVDPNELMNMSTELSGRGAKTPNMQGGGSHRLSFPTADEIPSTTSVVGGVGEEEIWVHRILYIIAKVANFRANIPQFQEPSTHDEQVRQQSRFAEWQRLKTWCDMWNANCPRSMRPYGYLFASLTQSAFPNVWLIKRSAIVGRLFYHTAMCLLAQINPLRATRHDDEETRPVQLHHAHQVCGIVAHTKDHGVASVAIRSLAIAGSVLHEPREQHEVIDILTRIYHHTGWNLNRIHLELKRAWGWEPPEPPLNLPASGPGCAAGLPHSTPQQQAAQGGTLGAAAVISQLFGPRSSDDRTNQDQRPLVIPRGTPAPVHLPLPPPPPPPITMPQDESRRADFPAGPPSLSTTLSQPLLSTRRNNSVTTTNPSSNTSPAATTHTPASVSSNNNNAPTPPSRPTVNPLLAQADFTQPNHPYREWYKPPERVTGGNSAWFKAGGLWPY